MKKAALLLGAALLFTIAAPVFAQRMFEDVPTDHWAYQAVNSLQERGIVIGYPDGTFSGKRAMTRYEFAVATARLIDWVNSQMDTRIAAIKPGGGITEEQARSIAREEAERAAGEAREAAVNAARDAAQEAARDAVREALANVPTRQDLETVRRLVEEFRDELQTLGADVQRLQDQINNLKERVGAIEEALKRIQISGEGTVIWRGANSTSVGGARRQIFDLDSRTDLGTGTNSNILQNCDVLYQLAVGITGQVTPDITANAVLLSGNYLPWAASNRLGPGGIAAIAPNGQPVQGNFGTDAANLASAELTPLKMYMQGKVGDLWFLKDVDLTVGKFGYQLGPYVLKQVDPDSYTTTSVTDSGDVIMSGAKVTANIGKLEVSAYAATHDRNGVNRGYGVFETYGGPTVLNPVAYNFFTIDQSAAIRGQIGLGRVTLAATYLEGGISSDNPAAPRFGQPPFPADPTRREVQRAQVISADLSIPITENLSLSGTWARGLLLQGDSPDKTATIGNRESAFPAFVKDKDKAWDARLNLGLGRLTLAAGYKHIDPMFGAPGYWGAIGRWKNPTNIKGPNGEIGYAFSDRLSLSASIADYKSPVEMAALDNLIRHYRAGLRYDVSSANRVDLGWEEARIRPGVSLGPETRETYWTLGFGHTVNENISWKVAYQFIDYKDNGAKLYTLGTPYKGGVGVTQVSVRF
jgi:predicted porin